MLAIVLICLLQQNMLIIVHNYNVTFILIAEDNLRKAVPLEIYNGFISGRYMYLKYIDYFDILIESEYDFSKLIL